MFFQNYPIVLFEIIPMIVSQVLGQMCIYYVVVNFRQHIFPLISTFRKVITVILSVWYFGHHIGAYQLIAIAVMLFGITYELSS